MRSLRSRLFVLWVLSAAASLAVGVLLFGLYRQSSSAELAQTEAALSQACAMIADRYAYYAAGWAGPPPGAEPDDALRADLEAVVATALAPYPGLAGGIAQQGRPALAGAVPPALQDTLNTLTAAADADDRALEQSVPGRLTTTLLIACPLRGPIPGLVAFTLARLDAAAGQSQLFQGVAILLALVLGITLLLSWLIVTWTRRIATIETALASHASGTLPRLAPTGERELDGIVAALNLAGERLDAARARAETLASQVAVAERLAAIGRVAAGVAHEIRNPIAVMRLKAENALAGDDARRRTALDAILAQIARLDRLLTELLTMTQSREPMPETVSIPTLLEAAAADHRRDGITITTATTIDTATIDPALVRRILDALLDNAVAHSDTIALAAERHGGHLRITVADTGPGIPEDMRNTLFEPFVTGRADGTGLGLAIAREHAQAHGGTLDLADPGPGAVFLLSIPCPSS